MKFIVAPLSIRAERVCWSWRPIEQMLILIFSLFLGLIVHRKNLEGMVVGEALLGHLGRDKVFIEMV